MTVQNNGANPLGLAKYQERQYIDDNKDHYPIISWVPGNIRDFLVVSKKNDCSRIFSLIDRTTVVSDAVLATPDIGYCSQKWIRQDQTDRVGKHLEVRMFTTLQRGSVFFVVTDLVNKKIAVYPETLIGQAWKRRIYHEEPNLDRGFWGRFSGEIMPKSITWIKESTTTFKLWQRTYDKSLEGVVEANCVLNTIQVEEVVFAAYTKASEGGVSGVAYKIELRTRRPGDFQTKDILYRFLPLDWSKLWVAGYSKEGDCPSTEDLNGGMYMGDLSLSNKEMDPRISFYKRDIVYTNFMPNYPRLVSVPAEDICAYFNSCFLNNPEFPGTPAEIADKVKVAKATQIMVTKETYEFSKYRMVLPSVRISITQDLCTRLLNSSITFFRDVGSEIQCLQILEFINDPQKNPKNFIGELYRKKLKNRQPRLQQA